MKRLVIDDVRTFNFEADYCRTTEEFRNLYDDWDDRTYWPHYDECWLDNDMGSDNSDDDVSYLVNELEAEAADGGILPISVFVIHTANPVEREKMYQALHKWYDVRFENASDFLEKQMNAEEENFGEAWSSYPPVAEEENFGPIAESQESFCGDINIHKAHSERHHSTFYWCPGYVPEGTNK